MDESKCIRIWLRDAVPERFRSLFPSEEDTGMFVVFVAHVPGAVADGRTYQQCLGGKDAGFEGWMREGECGLFGINALNIYPDPDGDGAVILGSCV